MGTAFSLGLPPFLSSCYHMHPLCHSRFCLSNTLPQRAFMLHWVNMHLHRQMGQTLTEVHAGASRLMPGKCGQLFHPPSHYRTCQGSGGKVWVDSFLCFISFIQSDMFPGYPVKMVWPRRKETNPCWLQWERVKINDVQISLLPPLTSALPPLHPFPLQSAQQEKQMLCAAGWGGSRIEGS